MRILGNNFVCRLVAGLFMGLGFAGVVQAASLVQVSDSSSVQDVIVNEFSGVTLTVALKEVSEIEAVFAGNIEMDEDFVASSYGIVYSTEPSFNVSSANVISVVDECGSNAYSVMAKDLMPSTTYYYTSYIKYLGLYKYGEVKSFTTSSVPPPAMGEVSSIAEVSAEVSGQIHPTTKTPKRISYGVQYSSFEDFSSDMHDVKVSNYGFGLYMPSLVPGTTYYCRSYVMVNGKYEYGQVQSFTTASIIAPEITDVKNITEVSARVSGTLALSDMYEGAQYGVQFSSETDFSDPFQLALENIGTDGAFRLKVDSLLPSTTYYYRPYTTVNGVCVYGKNNQFTTKTLVVPELDEASNITRRFATISGQLFLASGFSQDMQYGVRVSASASMEDGHDLEISDLDPNCRFSITDSYLRPATTYYYCSYVRMNGTYYYGAVKSFTTTSLDPSMPFVLSSEGSANCYIVPGCDYYKFKTVKGNSDISVGDVASAEVLWESFGTSVKPSVGDLVTNVSYNDGYITFKTADDFREGNAVIAAKDASGNILWSWHIWLTDQPEEQVYYNNAGTMMDRNLGATSASPGDVGALGLLYQWGRKDPFLGASSISSSTVAQSTITWSRVSSSSISGTIEYATAHPTTFVTYNSDNNDWYYTGSSSTDDTRWTPSEKDKSIYDPCPPGWRVPDGGSNGIWSKAKGSSSNFRNTYDWPNNGMNFSGKFGGATTIWYPASGCRHYIDGSLNDVSNYGIYWSVSPYGSNSSKAYDLSFDYNGNVYPLDYYYRAYGYSVRCTQE